MSYPADFGPPHRLILVRHGLTEHTVADLISGAGSEPQPALTEEGMAQARAAATLTQLWAPRVDQFITSPLLRARQTAGAIAELLGTAPVADPDWAEAHFGRWEGLSVEAVVQDSPGEWEAMIGDPMLGPPGGESLDAVRRRVLNAWDRLVRPGQTSVVVTHLTPIRIAVSAALAVPHEAFGRITARPGSLTVIDRWADGASTVVTVGERL
jgi:ribonuclease H / adenosylcobalamin/alpha-ribazole phosphatase